jgi:hypothetical protein
VHSLTTTVEIEAVGNAVQGDTCLHPRLVHRVRLGLGPHRTPPTTIVFVSVIVTIVASTISNISITSIAVVAVDAASHNSPLIS